MNRMIPSSLKKNRYTARAIPRNSTSRYSQVRIANVTSSRRCPVGKASGQSSCKPSRLRRRVTRARAEARSCRLGKSSRSERMK
ncbi:hypothetical protein D3C80_1996710 [compost metagenome]